MVFVGGGGGGCRKGKVKAVVDAKLMIKVGVVGGKVAKVGP